MQCALMLKGWGHELVSASTAAPCSHHTVTDMEPQNVSQSLKACRIQQIRAVKPKHWKVSISTGI